MPAKSHQEQEKTPLKQPNSVTESDSSSSDDSHISQYLAAFMEKKYTPLIQDCEQKIEIATVNIEGYQEEIEKLLQKIDDENKALSSRKKRLAKLTKKKSHSIEKLQTALKMTLSNK